MAVLFFYLGGAHGCISNTGTLVPESSRVSILCTDQHDDNGDRWIVAELTIYNATLNDSGCYQCVAASSQHVEADTSRFIIVESKLIFCT